MSDKYNGWANYPTWNVKLWIDNSEGDYLYWRSAAQEAAEEALDDGPRWDGDTPRDAAVEVLAKKLESEIEAPEVTGMFADIMGWALGQVDWQEIATVMIDDDIATVMIDDDSELTE